MLHMYPRLTRCCAFAGCGTSITNWRARTELGSGRRAGRTTFNQWRASSLSCRCMARPSNTLFKPRTASCCAHHTLSALQRLRAAAPGRPDLHDGHVPRRDICSWRKLCGLRSNRRLPRTRAVPCVRHHCCAACSRPLPLPSLPPHLSRACTTALDVLKPRAQRPSRERLAGDRLGQRSRDRAARTSGYGPLVCDRPSAARHATGQRAGAPCCTIHNSRPRIGAGAVAGGHRGGRWRLAAGTHSASRPGRGVRRAAVHRWQCGSWPANTTANTTNIAHFRCLSSANTVNTFC